MNVSTTLVVTTVNAAVNRLFKRNGDQPQTARLMPANVSLFVILDISISDKLCYLA